MALTEHPERPSRTEPPTLSRSRSPPAAITRPGPHMAAGPFSFPSRKETSMFRALMHALRKLPTYFAKTANWLARRLRRAWADHLDRVGSNPGYAAAAAAVLAGGLGLMAAHEVVG